MTVQIAQLQTQVDDASKRLREISKTRSFFRGGVEKTVTIGNISDINRTKEKINSLNAKIEDLKNPKPESIKITTKPTVEPVQVKTERKMVSNVKENTSTKKEKPSSLIFLLGALILGAMIL